ncbi:MAG: tetratricopeptide repeat protein [Alphaproteobacteria bacterium]|nr:tetratricopeptide repeat protein [Alphaproteobacteria bacterium]
MRRIIGLFLIAAIAMMSVLPYGQVRATPLEADDCYSQDLMRRIEGCSQLLNLPHLAPSVRAQAFSLRALALSLIGRYNEAVNDYDQALSLMPNQPVTLNNRAWALYKMGRFAEAVPDVEKSIQHDNTSPHAFDTRAHLRQANGEADGAYNDYQKAMELGGTHMVRLYQCGLQAYGLYQGPVSGIFSSALDRALKLCVKRADCDPLPPDEECKAALS